MKLGDRDGGVSDPEILGGVAAPGHPQLWTGGASLSRERLAGRKLNTSWKTAEKGLLLLAGLILVYAALVNSETYDERAHINAAYHILSTGDLTWDPNNTPLRAVFGLPALALGMERPTHFEQALPGDVGQRVLIGGRMIAIGLFLLWAWGYGRLARRWLGPQAGLACLAMVLFSPTITGLVPLTITDVLAAMAFFLAAAAAYEQFLQPRWGKTLLLALAIALCFLAKFSALLWIAGIAAGVLIAFFSTGLWKRPAAVLRRLIQYAAALLLALVIVAIPYRFEGVGQSLGRMDLGGNGLGARIDAVEWVPSPLPRQYVRGLDSVMDMGGWRPAYFAGEAHARSDFPLYFAGLLLLKPPLALHLLLVLAGIGMIARKRWKKAGLILFSVPCLLLFGYSAKGGVQIGVRHILPVFPFLILAAAWSLKAVSAHLWRLIALAAAFLFVLSGLLSTPHQLACFNAIAGGPEGAWRYYNDSNQDWGQGWYHLQRYLRRKERTVEYFPQEGQTTGWIAQSTNQITGLTPQMHEDIRWLREGFEPRRFVPPYWHLYYIEKDHWSRQMAPGAGTNNADPE